MERGEAASSEHYEQVMYSPYDEHRFCTAIRSIDTVRSLHQTVVSLRSALEDSRQEIEKLKKQILITNEIQDARHCQHPEIVQQQQHQIDYKTLDQKVSALEKIYYKAHPQKQQQQQQKAESKDETKEKTKIDGSKKTISLVPDITISTQNLNDSSGANNNNHQLQNNQMASRIDVKIKVSSNINVTDNNSNENETSTEDGASESSESTPQPPSNDGGENEKAAKSDASKRENPKVEVEMYEDSNTNTFNVDGKNLKIKVTSEESINVRRSVERISIQQSSTEYLNLSIEDLSEGDNSVFTEGATTPIEVRLNQVEDMTSDTEQALDNETGEFPREEREETDDIIEEVDDIELIFSSEDNKDMIQEDLVSISEYEPWQEPGEAGTPILTKFNTLASDDLDREAYYQKKKALKAARVRAKEGNKSLESTDSLSFDNNIRSSMDYNASSLDKDSSFENPISRDNSFDAFTRPNIAGRAKKWTNVNVLVETDISKVGIGDENVIEMGRRNTCPNPPIYRPLGYSQNRSSFRTPLSSRYPRSISRSNHCPIVTTTQKESGAILKNEGTKCNSSAAQTDITALPHQWRSETHLICNDYGSGYTLPSKYNSPQGHNHNRSGMKNSLRLSEKTQEQRRVLLSDINFTSMVPELSRSADHLCQQKINEEADEESSDYFKGNLLKTPDYTQGLTPSTSTPGVSQWTVNESTTQTEGFWNNRGDSFDSSKSYSMRSGISTNLLNKHQRSRSVPSIRCAICKRNHSTIKPSESMHYAASKTVTFREPSQKARGSLPDLRNDCHCSRRCGGKSLLYRMHESSGSTESLLEEADEYMRHCSVADNNNEIFSSDSTKRCGENRRCSEADAMRGYHPSKQSLPFLPKSPRCLKSGQLAKVIARSGRIVVGKIRFVGPIANADDETYVGLQLPHAQGDCDGTFNGNKFFECEKLHGLFVPYKKVVMAWN